MLPLNITIEQNEVCFVGDRESALQQADRHFCPRAQAEYFLAPYLYLALLSQTLRSPVIRKVAQSIHGNDKH